jgi:RimJ/RimL family protein N-acetyltransferase
MSSRPHPPPELTPPELTTAEPSPHELTPPEPSPAELTTARLLLRPWREADREPFAAMNADPAVMEFFPSPMTRARSDALVDRIRAVFAQLGYGLWAVEVRATGAFAGFVGLHPAPDAFPSAPAMEIGWRLARPHWGQGFATEAARTVIDFAFGPAGLTELVSYTTVTNVRSQNVMRKLGMTHDPADDFDNPLVAGWWGAPHVVYRLKAADWPPRPVGEAGSGGG